MASFVFDYAKGRWIEKFSLPIGGDNIVIVLLQSTGLQADATLNNYPTLGALLASNTEANFTNYARKTVSPSGITISVNVSNGVVTVDIPDQTWSAAGGATNNSLGAFVTCYKPSSASVDYQIIPLTKHDFAITTNGGDLTASVPSIGTST